MNVPRPPGAALAAALALACACATTNQDVGRPAPPEGANTGPGSPASDRAVIKSAWLRVLREDPKSGVRDAEVIATRMGGYASASAMESATLMVPAPKLEEALAALAALGKVEHREVRARDVTEARADLELRLANLRRARDRYLEILGRASTVAETLAVEKELERITLEIERLQTALQQMNQSVALATVDVQFARPVAPGPVGWVLYGLYSAVKWLLVWD